MSRLCDCQYASQCKSQLVRNTGGETFRLCQTDAKYRTILLRGTPPATDSNHHSRKKGVGHFLSIRIASIVKIKPDAGCGCVTYATQLDGWGPDKCEQNADEIVDKLTDEKHREMISEALGLHRYVVDSVPGVWVMKKVVRSLLALSIKDARASEQRHKQTHIKRLGLADIKNAPTIPHEPIPFTAEPKITLLFHVWPHGDGWRRHLTQLESVVPHCHRKILGIAYDSTTATVDETKEAFGPGWEYVVVNNAPARKGRSGLREVATYSKMLPMLSRNVNDVTLCLHGKGSQDHTAASDPIAWWIDAMYETVAHNLPEVIEHMRKGAAIVGSFRRHGSHFRSRHGWHYSGTFYAFRNCIAFSNGIPALRQMWWGTESWPGDYFPRTASACIFGDNCGDLYKVENQPRDELKEWRRAR